MAYSILTQTAVLLLLACIAVVVKCFYNVYLHPLRGFPGPRLWAASRLPLIYWNFKGTLIFTIPQLHDKYGPVVRVGPDELTFESGQAWKDIYGHRSPEMPKSLKGHGLPPPSNGVHALLTAPTKEEHARMRRPIAHAFSDKALRSQEHFLAVYVTELIKSLREKCENGPIDMEKRYNFTTFDAIGDLAFGESFDCLKNDKLHSWIDMIFKGVSMQPYIQALQYYNLYFLLPYIIPKKTLQAVKDQKALVKAKLARRLEKGVDEERGDFLSYILKVEDGRRMNAEELQTVSAILIVGGSETTATLLSGATYYLCKTPRVLRKLASDIRSRFKSEAEIDLVSLNAIPYLTAVLEESLRMFPPVATGLARIVPGSGETIDGHFVPAGTAVGVHQFTATRSARNWASPLEFIPERWNPETEDDKRRFENDDKLASSPFSLGPRNCIGRNLAYAEMRLILARILYNFDIELAPESDSWADKQRAGIIWMKGPLMIQFTPVSSTQS